MLMKHDLNDDIGARPWALGDSISLAAAMSEIRAGRLGEQLWLLDGLIPDAAVTLLYGPSGSGKSTLARFFAIYVAREFGRCVYIAAEDFEGSIRALSALAADGNGAPDIEVRRAFNLGSRADVNKLALDISGTGTGLIVIDTLTCALGGLDPDRGADAARLMDNAHNLAQATGAAVVVTHHSGHGGGGPRGSSLLLDRPDIRLRIGGSVEAGRLTIAVEKNRFAPGGRRFEFDLAPITATIGDADLSAVQVVAQREVSVQAFQPQRERGRQMRIVDRIKNLLASIEPGRHLHEQELVTLAIGAGIFASDKPDSARRAVVRVLPDIEASGLILRKGKTLMVQEPDNVPDTVRTGE